MEDDDAEPGLSCFLRSLVVPEALTINDTLSVLESCSLLVSFDVM